MRNLWFQQAFTKLFGQFWSQDIFAISMWRVQHWTHSLNYDKTNSWIGKVVHLSLAQNGPLFLGGPQRSWQHFSSTENDLCNCLSGTVSKPGNPSPLSRNLLKGIGKNVWQAVHVGWFFEYIYIYMCSHLAFLGCSVEHGLISRVVKLCDSWNLPSCEIFGKRGEVLRWICKDSAGKGLANTSVHSGWKSSIHLFIFFLKCFPVFHWVLLPVFPRRFSTPRLAFVRQPLHPSFFLWLPHCPLTTLQGGHLN